jgi:hypothetical protein
MSIKIPEIKLSTFGIKGGNFIEDMMFRSAEKSMNKSISSSINNAVNGIVDPFKRAFNLRGNETRGIDTIVAQDQLREEAATASVELAQQATVKRLEEQFPARTDYVIDTMRLRQTRVVSPDRAKVRIHRKP